MIPALARFVDALRAEGVAVSPPEAVDAARALEIVGLEQRGTVRRALAAVLAKDRAARATFERLFDAFFATPRLDGEGKGKGRPAGAREGGKRPQKGSDPFSRERRSEKGKKGPGPFRKEADQKKGKKGSDPKTKIVRAERTRDVTPSPRKREITRRMTTDEERQVAREIPRVVAALRMKPGRRRREARAGRPWLRKALRRSTATQGVPFVLPMHRPKRRSTRVVMLVDVSYSVARAAGLFLLVAGAFVEIGRRARVLCFVDRPVDATDAIARWIRGRARPSSKPTRPRPAEGIARRGVSFADVLSGMEGLNLDAPSDYGRALHALRSARPSIRGRDTLLVVLGDARANRFDPLPWAFEEVAAACGGVVWLIPEPAARWGTGDSALPGYLPSIDVLVEATDLTGLAAGVAEMRRRLS